MRGRRTIDARARIAAKRHAAGLDHGYTPSELAGMREGSKRVSFDRNSINTRDDRSVGKVSGLSDIMRRSDPDERQAPPLTDPAEHARNRNEISEAFQAGA